MNNTITKQAFKLLKKDCDHEVELLMNAFNIKYKRIDELVYG